MGAKSQDHLVKEKGRKAFTVPLTAGDYASERISFGIVGTGELEQSFMRISAWMEANVGSSPPSGCVLELWVQRITTSDEAASAHDDADYTFSGKVVVPAGVSATVTGAEVSFGLGTWEFGGIPGAQLRVRSGGVSGSVVVNGVAF